MINDYNQLMQTAKDSAGGHVTMSRLDVEELQFQL